MSLYSYSNMFFGCLVSLLNLCRLKYWQAPMWYGVVFVFSQLYSKASHVFPHVCRLRIMGIIGVRQIVISGQCISTISTQYSSTGLPSATSITFSCQQVAPEVSYLQSLALFHITSVWSDQDFRGNQCSIIPLCNSLCLVYYDLSTPELMSKCNNFLQSVQYLRGRISQDIIIWSPIANPNILMIKFMHSDDKVYAFWW